MSNLAGFVKRIRDIMRIAVDACVVAHFIAQTFYKT